MSLRHCSDLCSLAVIRFAIGTSLGAGNLVLNTGTCKGHDILATVKQSFWLEKVYLIHIQLCDYELIDQHRFA